MKSVRWIAAAIVFVLLSGFLQPAALADASTAAPVLDVKSALLLDMNSGTVLLDQNADKQIAPASLTKIMTTMLALQKGKLTDTLTVSASALAEFTDPDVKPSLIEGEQFTLEQLCELMMITSNNEACNVVAEYVSGSISAFVALMNDTAASLGCTGTHFANPHGLSASDHYSTARDLAIIAQAALKIDEFRTLCNTVSAEIPATALSDARQLSTTNLLISPSSPLYYSKAFGIKTGHTTEAGYCLISTAENDTLNLLGVVCGASVSTDSLGDSVGGSFAQMQTLFEYGFKSFTFQTVLSKIDTVTSVPVLWSAGVQSIVVVPDQDITALLPSDYDQALLQKDIVLDSPDGVEAPVSAGDVMGSITVSYDGQVLGTAQLLAIADAPRSSFAYCSARIRSLLSNGFVKLGLAMLIAFVIIYLLYFSFTGPSRRRRRKGGGSK